MNQRFDRKAVFVLGAWVVYALAFSPLHRWAGGMALSLAIVPVAATGRLLGMRAGLVAGLVAFPVNVALMLLVAGTASETLLTSGGLLSSTVVLLIGVGVGRLHDLGKDLREQLAKRAQAEKALREERDFSSAVLDTATVLVVVLDPQGRIVRFNQACERITGYPFDEVKGRTVWDLFLISEEVAPVRAVFEELKAGKAPNEYENYWVTKDGGRRLIAWSNAPLFDDEGTVEYIIGAGIDITERVEAEKLLRRRNQELTARNAVAQALSTSLHLQDVLDEAVSGTVATLDFTGGLVSLADEYTGELSLFSHVGLPSPLIERLETEGLAGTLCYLVYQESIPLDLEDLSDGAPIDTDSLLSMGLHAYAGVPIIHRDNTLGTLCLFDTAPHSISETDFGLLAAIGQQIGIAVENARLFRDIVHEREVAQTLLETAEALSTTLRIDVLLQRVLDELQRVVPYEEASINMMSKTSSAEGEGSRDSSPVVWTVASRGTEQTSSRRHSLVELPLMQRVVQDRGPIIVSDVDCELSEPDPVPSLPIVESAQRRGSLLGVPLISKDEIVGVLTVASSRPYAYDKAAARLAYAFAHQVALAIENSRLYEETRARLREVDLLYGVTAAFSSTLDIDQMLPYVARSLCEMLNGTDVEIYNLNHKTSTITVAAAYTMPGLTEDEDAQPLTPGQTLHLADSPMTAQALDLCRPIQVQVDDAEADPLEQAALEARGAWAALIVPMLARGHVVGLVKVWDRQGPRRFTRSEIALGQTLIHQAAVAFENARLYKEIEERRSYLESVLAAAPDAIVTLDARHHIVEWNLGAERLFGYSREEAIGQDIDHLVTNPDMFQEAVGFSQLVMEGENIRPVETIRRRKDGSPVDVIVAGSPVMAGGELAGAVAVYTDISERKQAEEALRKLSQAVNQSPALIIITNREGVIEYVNPKLTTLTGYAPEEVIGQNPRILQSSEVEPNTHKQLWDTITAGMEWRGEFHNKKKDGEGFWVSASISPITDAEGEITHFVSVQEDITELKRTEEALRQAKEAAEAANRAKSTFLANMSHELRTPLNAILGFAQLMERSSSFPADHRENLRTISHSGEHLLDLINDVLDMSKIEAGRTTLNPVDFDLHSMLDDVETLVRVRAQSKLLHLEFVRAPNVPRFVRTDERKLKQVLINLLNNAVKFTHEGSVTLRVGGKTREVKSRQGEDASPTLPTPSNASSSHSLLHFEVEDKGVGIAPEEMDRLFDPFAQTESGRQSQQGTGLGLPISREFVAMMGGELTVSSQVGHGTIFQFDIVVQTAEMADVAETELTRPDRHIVGLEPHQPECRILVVDDRVENRFLMRELLEPLGFVVREATNGKEAVDLHESWQPHLIWMDMRMPVMDGYEATRQIKGTVQGRTTTIIALTASAMESDQSLTLSAGCDDYVRKPFREAEIFDKLARHLDVRFVYREEDQSADQGESAVQEALTPEALAALPQDWIAKLRDAANRARGDLILGLLTQIEQDHAGLARALAQLVDEFQFDRIVSLTEQLAAR